MLIRISTRNHRNLPRRLLIAELANVPPTPVATIVVGCGCTQFINSTIQTYLARSVPFRRIVIIGSNSASSSLSILNKFSNVRILSVSGQKRAKTSQIKLSRTATPCICFLSTSSCPRTQVSRIISKFYSNEGIGVRFRLHNISRTNQSLQSIFPAFPFKCADSKVHRSGRQHNFRIYPPDSKGICLQSTLRTLSLAVISRCSTLSKTITLIVPRVNPITAVSRPLTYCHIRNNDADRCTIPASRVVRQSLIQRQQH